MSIQTVVNLVIYLVFVYLGYLTSKRINPPETTSNWVVWIVVVILAGGICVSARAININDIVDLHVNDMLQALGIGILAGFAIASRKKVGESNNQVETK